MESDGKRVHLRVTQHMIALFIAIAHEKNKQLDGICQRKNIVQLVPPAVHPAQPKAALKRHVGREIKRVKCNQLVGLL